MVKATHLGEKTLNKSWSSRLGVSREASSLTQEKLPAKITQRGNAGQMILGRPRHVKRMKKEQSDIGTWNVNPYPTAFPYGNGMVLHFYQQQESSTTKTVHKVINKGLKTYV